MTPDTQPGGATQFGAGMRVGNGALGGGYGDGTNVNEVGFCNTGSHPFCSSAASNSGGGDRSGTNTGVAAAALGSGGGAGFYSSSAPRC